MPDVQEQKTKNALKDKIDALSPALLAEVEDFVEFVVAKRAGASDGSGDESLSSLETEGKRTLQQSWAGGLSHLKKEYTSVELKNEALERWMEAAQD
ncbi:MAG: hypothetical protein BRD38_03755 [Bacteroidetes bacterium QH_9_67_14]|nr:MAG: hypothetical protein BRD38_03755 [Bacteroidetes bacterium QH_9_67_14]